MVFVCSKCKRDVDTPGQFCPYCGTPAPPPETDASDPFVGRTIAGKYFVNQRLGAGGMGQVYKATDVVLDRPVALKMLNRSLLTDPSMVQRFHREARAASRLNHPNCITILDFGQTEDHALYIAMEFLAGRSLAKVIAEESPVSQARIARIGSQVLAALAEAHAGGIIHRDLKPSNVMVEARREEADFVKVLDFGIAKLSGPGEAPGQLTSTGIVCGTPGYMSPEQARGEELDPRSDLYAVGVILYELLTGRLPFESATPMGFVAKHMSEPPVAPRERRPDLPISADLDALVVRAMAKDREERPASAEAFREELLACRIEADLPDRPTPRPAPSTLFIQAPKSGPSPVKRIDPPSGARPRGATPAPRGATPAPDARPATPAPARAATPMPARPATPRPATPAPARRATPAPVSRDDGDEAEDLRDEPAPKPQRPPRPPVRGGRPGSRRGVVVAAAVGGVVLVGALAALLLSDPFSKPASKESSGGEQALTLTTPTTTGTKTTTGTTTTTATGNTTGTGTTPTTGTTTTGTPTTTGTTPIVTTAQGDGAPPGMDDGPPKGGTSKIATPTTHVAPPKPKKGSGVLEVAEGVKILKVPGAGSGQGLLAVTASPWGVVVVDGKEIGETPRELRVGEGFYKVKVTHPTLGARDTVITVAAGRRAAYNVTFSR